MNRPKPTPIKEQTDDATPLHHYPSAQGIHMANLPSPDAWQQFVQLVLEAAETIDRRRAASSKQTETD